jgi:arylsulfatase A-like enzyme
MIYEEKIFVDRCLEMVDDHPSPSVPFFLNYCSHIVHSPLQAPSNLYHTFDFMANDYDKHRQIYASMVAYLDEGVGKIVDALTDSHMVNDQHSRIELCWPQIVNAAASLLNP